MEMNSLSMEDGTKNEKGDSSGVGSLRHGAAWYRRNAKPVPFDESKEEWIPLRPLRGDYDFSSRAYETNVY